MVSCVARTQIDDLARQLDDGFLEPADERVRARQPLAQIGETGVRCGKFHGLLFQLAAQRGHTGHVGRVERRQSTSIGRFEFGQGAFSDFQFAAALIELLGEKALAVTDGAALGRHEALDEPIVNGLKDSR